MYEKNSSKSLTSDETEMRPEYDFTGAVRGKHYHPLHEGYTIIIHKADGTTETQEVKFETGTVRLEPEVQAYFPNSQAVNTALRSLIALMAEFTDVPKRKKTLRTKKPLSRRKLA